MRFWDSSALVPLCFRESASDAVRRIAKADEDMVVWWTSRVECISAMARRQREGVLSAEAGDDARAILTFSLFNVPVFSIACLRIATQAMPAAL